MSLMRWMEIAIPPIAFRSFTNGAANLHKVRSMIPGTQLRGTGVDARMQSGILAS